MIEEKFSKTEEVKSGYFPSSILESLALRAVSKFYPDFIRTEKFIVNKNTRTPNTGFVQIIKSSRRNYDLRDMAKIIEEVYSELGFNTEKEQEDKIIAKKDSEEYSIRIFDSKCEFTAYVSKNSAKSY